jgi:hypothetical protein
VDTSGEAASERTSECGRLIRSFAADAVRLQLHALAYNLANFMRTLALPEAVAHWSLTSLREKLVKIGAKIVTHARYVTFRMAEFAVQRHPAAHRGIEAAAYGGASVRRSTAIRTERTDGRGAPC